MPTVLCHLLLDYRRLRVLPETKVSDAELVELWPEWGAAESQGESALRRRWW
jgi:hypothetical protein